ncbi:lipoprotein localization protein LolB [Dickeya dianthicola]|uniref:Outer-membrane lipoprotein LolB n=2 Tax=Dickeya dianthicola TaxID=204039 RepID=A0AAP6VDE2_9GAMM|nr:lipoprotein insertase outer membrane protein LolB [Dickeya dianthicola]ATO33200.1 Outer membrane lipoprotein LolB precursor [Dickeya dianthicola RNS04.9]MBT1428174.1 lipoprotein insertase outer membrane protein LolB [Dickeya dianthicola]MBT1432240.1 lipoprotein insertase outer membrane protein LolB [Dickeya dianthicola]MBT1459688.1 lipoprotein insertase outer membrane protein LolB [Dickeya dianthicola]MBT1488886.1 lipoprotein insertase outer membrane protein LolB [Dickeya dianthicola]
MPNNPVRALRLLPLASVLLTACTLTQPTLPGKKPTSPEWREHEQKVQNLTHYQTRGSFAYISDRKKLYARFFWQQFSPQRYRLLLTSPLGSTELELQAGADSVQITDGQGKRYVGKDAQYMVQQLTGMAIPLDNLRQWMLGLPGDAQDFALDERALLRSVNYQQGDRHWSVSYQSYTNDPLPLPQSLELTQGEQRIKLKMDNWAMQ